MDWSSVDNFDKSLLIWSVDIIIFSIDGEWLCLILLVGDFWRFAEDAVWPWPFAKLDLLNITRTYFPGIEPPS